MNDNNMNNDESLETMKKNIADNIKQLDDIKRRVELLGHGYSEKEYKFDDTDLKITSLEKENEKLRRQLFDIRMG
jgi:septation ring formation regulator EzrA